MLNQNPISRKTTYRVTFTTVTIDGDVKTGTKWFNEMLDIPTKYFGQDNAQLIERSYDVFEKPSFSDFKKCVSEGNKFWLNTNEVIREIN